MPRDKVAWITGGGSGIGLAGGIELAKAGAHVIVSGRSAETLKKAEKEIKAAGSGEAIALDVADQNEVAKAAAEIAKRHGRVDILINSAGINHPKRNFRNVSIDGWNQIVAVNLSGMFYCVQAVLPGMRERKAGLIINISSWAGRYASTLTGPGYNATKHAVVALTESINMEECMNGIRATSILPGEVATPILEKRPVPPSTCDLPTVSPTPLATMLTRMLLPFSQVTTPLPSECLKIADHVERENCSLQSRSASARAAPGYIAIVATAMNALSRFLVVVMGFLRYWL